MTDIGLLGDANSRYEALNCQGEAFVVLPPQLGGDRLPVEQGSDPQQEENDRLAQSYFERLAEAGSSEANPLQNVWFVNLNVQNIVINNVVNQAPDPADVFIFIDDSEDIMRYTTLTQLGTALQSNSGFIDGSGSSGKLAVWSDTDTIGYDPSITASEVVIDSDIANMVTSASIGETDYIAVYAGNDKTIKKGTAKVADLGGGAYRGTASQQWTDASVPYVMVTPDGGGSDVTVYLEKVAGQDPNVNIGDAVIYNDVDGTYYATESFADGAIGDYEFSSNTTARPGWKVVEDSWDRFILSAEDPTDAGGPQQDENAEGVADHVHGMTAFCADVNSSDAASGSNDYTFVNNPSSLETDPAGTHDHAGSTPPAFKMVVHERRDNSQAGWALTQADTVAGNDLSDVTLSGSYVTAVGNALD